MQCALEFKNIVKRFPGVIALKGVNLKLMKGEILGVIGENGAGKSTLLKILSGFYTDYEGEILIDDKTVVFKNTREPMDYGIGVIYQELNYVNYISVAENIFMGKWPMKTKGIVDWKTLNKRAVEILQELETELDVTLEMHELSIAEKQMVEIAKSLVNKLDILVMDEPTAALTDKESAHLIRVVKRLVEKGVSVIFISHKLEEVQALTDRIHILRDGTSIIEGETKNFTKEDMITQMVGRKLSDLYPQMDTVKNRVIFEVNGLTSNQLVKPASLNVREGEILGVFGLMGAGRSTLARTIFGYYKPTAGTMKLEGKELNIKNCQDAISAGIAYLPSERKTEGLVLIQSIKDNIVMASLKKISGKSGVISKEKETQTAKKWIEKLGIKTPGDEVELRTLSGGNQQKVAIAKWLNTDCKVIIFNEPTRGIDVNAKYEVYKVMKEICAMGYGIIMISSELPEVLGIADRILVMRDGEIVAETEVNTTGQQELLQYALGN